MPAGFAFRKRTRLIIACIATVAILGPLAWFWQSSFLPASYSVMSMGYPDWGGNPPAHSSHGIAGSHSPATMQSRSVTSLTADRSRPADISVELVVRQQRFTLASGKSVEGFTVNGQSPGPTLEVTQGQLVEVRLVNESVEEGATLHWHGVDVPNAEDGVAGVTQDAVAVGKEHTYRFIAEQVGTFWYHSHQVSHEQVVGGLFGALVIHPAVDRSDSVDTVALAHVYKGQRTINGTEGDVRVAAQPGQKARVRVINTDNGTISAWVSTPYAVLAIDGTEIRGPTQVNGAKVSMGAGSRVDLEISMPMDGSAVRVHIGGKDGIVLGQGTSPPPVPPPTASVDFLTYGTAAPLDFAPHSPDREFRYDIGRRPGFIDGRPGLFWTVNGDMFPEIPMFMVTEGDVVRMRLSNHSGEVHPMHLHGHHALVLSRNGVQATGSQWWVDSLDVESGDTYDIAFVADNPGIWMDHCHNLPHVSEGLVAHVMYEGISTPFTIGGHSHNEPE